MVFCSQLERLYMSILVIFSFRLKNSEERFSAVMTKSKVPGKLRRKPGASTFDQFWNSLGYHGCVQTMLSIMYLCIYVYVSVYVCLFIQLHVCLSYGCLHILLHEVYVYIYILCVYRDIASYIHSCGSWGERALGRMCISEIYELN